MPNPTRQPNNRTATPRPAGPSTRQLEFAIESKVRGPVLPPLPSFRIDESLELFAFEHGAEQLLGCEPDESPDLASCALLPGEHLAILAQAVRDLLVSEDEPAIGYLRIETLANNARSPYCVTLTRVDSNTDRPAVLCRLERIEAARAPSTDTPATPSRSGPPPLYWSMSPSTRAFQFHPFGDAKPKASLLPCDDWIASVAEPGRERVRSAFEALLDGSEQTLALQYTITDSDGAPQSVSTFARRTNGAGQGSIIGYHLRESRAKSLDNPLRLFSYLARKVQLPILVNDTSGAISWCNAAFTETTGYELDELLGRHPTDFLLGPMSDRETVSYMQGRLKKGKAFHAELVQYKKNGAPYWTRIDGSPLVDDRGAVTHFVSFQSDITESKKTQSAILRNEVKFRSIFDYSHDALLLLSPKDGVIIEANQAAIALLDSERLVGQRLEEIFPDNDAFRIERLDGTVDETATSPRQTGEFVTQAGEIRPIELSVTRTPIGESVALFVTLRDISEKRLLEEQLRHSQRMEAVGRLSGGIAHDFNNLLAGLRGFSELLCNSRELSKKDHVYANEVLKITDRASKLTSRLLSFSRGKSDQPVVANLNDIINNLTPMLSRILKADVRFTCALEPKLGNVKVDPAQIEQVIMNLVVNGQEAIRSQDGILTLNTSMVALNGSELFITGKPEAGDYVRVGVRDNGHGIPSKVLEKIFEPFFTTKQGAGTGLGLSIVYGIIQSNGGHLMVESEVGEGTEFAFYFPRVLEAVQSEEPTDHQAQMPSATASDEGRTATILIAEDQEQVREILELGLGQSGYHLLVAQDGMEAIEMGHSHSGPIDLLLTDSIMPRASGCRVAKEMRELYPDIKIILISGLPQQESEDYKNLQVDAYVDKPFSIRNLLELIEKLVGVPR